MAGILYLVATPIGNLEDMTPRAVQTLREVDLIAAEDTRGSVKLLNHFDIHTPMTSYHEYNKLSKAHVLIDRLLQGESVAVVTDAGTPGISDPGEDLVRMALQNGRFCFEAFLPMDKKERAEILEELKTETRTIVLYEAPHRLVRTLEELLGALGDRNITLARELTKKHETIAETTIGDALRAYGEKEPRGEYVLVIEGRSRSELKREKQDAVTQSMTVEEHFQKYVSQGMDRKEAMKAVARDRGISRREVYSQLMT